MTDESRTDESSSPSLSYKDAGVDIDAGNALVDRIKGVAKRTHRPEVMGGLGGFGALCELPAGYKEPVLEIGRMLDERSSAGRRLMTLLAAQPDQQAIEQRFSSIGPVKATALAERMSAAPMVRPTDILEVPGFGIATLTTMLLTAAEAPAWSMRLK